MVCARAVQTSTRASTREAGETERERTLGRDDSPDPRVPFLVRLHRRARRKLVQDVVAQRRGLRDVASELECLAEDLDVGGAEDAKALEEVRRREGEEGDALGEVARVDEGLIKHARRVDLDRSARERVLNRRLDLDRDGVSVSSVRSCPHPASARGREGKGGGNAPVLERRISAIPTAEG